jgi:hypothetical protein
MNGFKFYEKNEVRASISALRLHLEFYLRLFSCSVTPMS